MSEEQVVDQENLVESDQTAIAASAEIHKGYDKVVNPEKVRQENVVSEPTVETPPEPILTNDQAKDLIAQVSRIPDLEKRLRDEGGRYGALKQQIEQIQQRITTAATTKEVAASVASADELLKELRGEGDDGFPELADRLKPAFEKMLATKGASPDIEQIIAQRMQVQKLEETKNLEAQLDELNPGWEKITGSKARNITCAPEFVEWMGTLAQRDAARLSSSRDPFFIAEMIDKHNEWAKAKTNPPAQQETPQIPNKRLAAAVLPSGTRQAPKGEPDEKAAIMAGYQKVAGKRM